MAEEKKVTMLSIDEKIVEICNDIDLSQKDGKNNFKGFEYFQPGQINNALNPLYKKYRITVYFHHLPCGTHEKTIIEKEKEREKTTIKTVKDYKCRLEVIDNESKEKRNFIAIYPEAEIQGATDIQDAGGTMTYAKRYMLMNLFNIAENTIDPDNQPTKEKKGGKTVLEICETIKKAKTESKLDEFWDWIDEARGYTETQRNVIRRTIEERRKEICE